jgi:hypothetical protein
MSEVVAGGDKEVVVDEEVVASNMEEGSGGELLPYGAPSIPIPSLIRR